MNTNMPKNPQFNKYYRKHQKCLKLKGLRPKTIEAYSRAIGRIGNYFDCRIDHLTSDQLLDYLNDLLDSHSWSAVKRDLYGLKFFYTRVLNKTWNDIPLIKPPKNTRISAEWSMARTCWHNVPIITAENRSIFPIPADTETVPTARTMKAGNGSTIN